MRRLPSVVESRERLPSVVESRERLPSVVESRERRILGGGGGGGPFLRALSTGLSAPPDAAMSLDDV